MSPGLFFVLKQLMSTGLETIKKNNSNFLVKHERKKNNVINTLSDTYDFGKIKTHIFNTLLFIY